MTQDERHAIQEAMRKYGREMEGGKLNEAGVTYTSLVRELKRHEDGVSRRPIEERPMDRIEVILHAVHDVLVRAINTPQVSWSESTDARDNHAAR